MKWKTKNMYVVLENIRSAHNVGSIFRTADGAGIQKLFLVGYTPTPIDRFGRVQPDIKKTALGADKTIPWEYFEDIKTLLTKLKETNVHIVVVEQHEEAKDYRSTKIEKDTAFIFGNEIDGVSKEVCEYADKIVEIPMRGKKESLNVSVSVGVILFHSSAS